MYRFPSRLVYIDPLALPIRVSNATITLTFFSNLSNARDNGLMLAIGVKSVPKSTGELKKACRGKARGHGQ